MSVKATQIVSDSTDCSTAYSCYQLENIKVCLNSILWGESTRDQWILFSRGQWYGHDVFMGSCQKRRNSKGDPSSVEITIKFFPLI